VIATGLRGAGPRNLSRPLVTGLPFDQPGSRTVGAHSQGETLDELRTNLEEVIKMLLEDGEPRFDSEFVGTQPLRVA
jgi:hypothetical protein